MRHKLGKWDHTPEPYRKSVHLDQDLADRAIEWITGHKSIKPDLPFMMLWASGSMHSPRHAPDRHIDEYKGKFDMGWDKAREEILERQIALGVVSPDTKLTERIDEIPAWDSLPGIRCLDEEKALYARQMEVFAAQMEWVDLQIGRVVKELTRIGEQKRASVLRDVWQPGHLGGRLEGRDLACQSHAVGSRRRAAI